MAEPQDTHARSETDATIVVEGSKGSSLPPIIPPTHNARTLVLCFDGTGDQFDSDNSNIVQLFTMLKKDEAKLQMVYYQAGIGTYTTPQIATPLISNLSKTLDEMIAWNLDAHVIGGYEFLMQNYNAGDKICIFGFSRGAYTARSLAGMIHKVGILPADNHQQVPFAYKMYTRSDEVGWAQSNAFKKAFSVDAPIEFIGVWDTVNSVGLIPRRLPFTTSNTIVRTFRHAISLDERRAKFKANLWNRPNEEEATLSISDKNKPAPVQPAGSSHSRTKSTLRDLERLYSAQDKNVPTDVDEVWFSGCHCDIGGGSVDNGVPHTLARITLRWMIRECFKTNPGILFNSASLYDIGLDPHTLYPIVLPRPPALPVDKSLRIRSMSSDVVPSSVSASTSTTSTMSEEENELHDALSPIYDQLSLSWSWWILEVLPMKHRFQRHDNSWSWWFGWNLGQGRVIPGQSSTSTMPKTVRVHRSVKMRLESETETGQKYKPKATVFDTEHVIWVD